MLVATGKGSSALAAGRDVRAAPAWGGAAQGPGHRRPQHCQLTAPRRPAGDALGLSFLLCARGWSCPPSRSIRAQPGLAKGWLPSSHLNPTLSFPESLSQSVSSQILYALISFLSFVEIPPENSGFIIMISPPMGGKPGLEAHELTSHKSHFRHWEVQGSQCKNLS